MIVPSVYQTNRGLLSMVSLISYIVLQNLATNIHILIKQCVLKYCTLPLTESD